MNDISNSIPNYERACGIWPDASNLRQSVDAVQRSADGMQHGLIEHVKSCIECICITILTDRGEEVPERPQDLDLLRLTLDSLGLQNTRGRSRIDSIVSAFNKLAGAIVDLRNERGVVGHGKDGFLDALSTDHLRSFLFVGDAVVGYLLAAYEGVEPNLSFTREPFERFASKSALIDRSLVMTAEVEDSDDGTPYLAIELRVGPGQVPTKLRVEPSRLLFHVERDAYVDLLSQSLQLEEPEPEETEETDVALAGLSDSRTEANKASAGPDVPEQVSTREYLGTLDPIEDDIKALLAPLNLSESQVQGVAREILTETESRMGPDWRTRAPLGAAMRISFAATLRTAGVGNYAAKQRATELFKWLTASDLLRELEDGQREEVDD